MQGLGKQTKNRGKSTSREFLSINQAKITALHTSVSRRALETLEAAVTARPTTLVTACLTGKPQQRPTRTMNPISSTKYSVVRMRAALTNTAKPCGKDKPATDVVSKTQYRAGRWSTVGKRPLTRRRKTRPTGPLASRPTQSLLGQQSDQPVGEGLREAWPGLAFISLLRYSAAFVI